MTDDEQQPPSDALRRLERLDAGGPGGRPKVSRWDRVVVRDARWAIGLAGRILIAVGLLMFGFVAYQLWGTGIETARAQNALESEFEELTEQLGDSPVITPPTNDVPPTTATTAADRPGSSTRPPRTTTTTAAPTTTTLPPIQTGDALGRIEIPRIGLEFFLVAGVGTEELKQGVGHYTETPMPGQLGNSAFAGHRTTYGQPFFSIDEVQPGDEIIVTTVDGRFIYRVTGQQIVSPDAYEVVTTRDPDVALLTLTSCHPRWSARERIVISATLDTEQSPPIGTPVRQYPTTTTATTTTTTTTAPTTPAGSAGGPTTSAAASTTPAAPTTVARPSAPSHPDQLSDEATDAFSRGWFSDSAAFVDVALWGALVAAVAVLAYLLARRYRRLWLGFAAGALPFLVALYFFYQNVNRLLPPAL